MKSRRLSKDFRLPDYLSEKQKEDIILAIKKGTPIIISGEQGPTGKTTLVNILRENGVTAYEKWECLEIELNDKFKSKNIPMEDVIMRRFKFITENNEKINKFFKLMDSKNLSREDLVLILTTIHLNFDIFPLGLLEKSLGIQEI